MSVARLLGSGECTQVPALLHLLCSSGTIVNWGRQSIQRLRRGPSQAWCAAAKRLLDAQPIERVFALLHGSTGLPVEEDEPSVQELKVSKGDRQEDLPSPERSTARPREEPRDYTFVQRAMFPSYIYTDRAAQLDWRCTELMRDNVQLRTDVAQARSKHQKVQELNQKLAFEVKAERARRVADVADLREEIERSRRERDVAMQELEAERRSASEALRRLVSGSPDTSASSFAGTVLEPDEEEVEGGLVGFEAQMAEDAERMALPPGLVVQLGGAPLLQAAIAPLAEAQEENWEAGDRQYSREFVLSLFGAASPQEQMDRVNPLGIRMLAPPPGLSLQELPRVRKVPTKIARRGKSQWSRRQRRRKVAAVAC